MLKSGWRIKTLQMFSKLKVMLPVSYLALTSSYVNSQELGLGDNLFNQHPGCRSVDE